MYDIYILGAAILAVIGFWIRVREAWPKKLLAVLFLLSLTFLTSRLYWAYTHTQILNKQFEYLYEFKLRNVSLLGGTLGAGIGLYFVSRWWKMPFLELTDSLVLTLVMSLLLARMGCVDRGCCFGGRTEVFWAIEVKKGMPAYEAFARKNIFSVFEQITIHPTQVYEILNIMIAYGVSFLSRVKRLQGSGVRTLLFFLAFTFGHGVVMSFRYPNPMSEPWLTRMNSIYLLLSLAILLILLYRGFFAAKLKSFRRKRDQ